MAKSILSKEELIQKLTDAFRRHGYEGASLARLAEETGLVKASLYYQFPRGKEDMGAAVLAAVGQRFSREIIEPLRGPGSPRERLAAMAAALSAFYSGGRQACLTELFGFGEAGALYRTLLERSVGTLCGAMAAVARDAGIDPDTAGRRAEDALIAIQGSLVLCRALDHTGPFERVIAELPDRLLAASVPA